MRIEGRKNIECILLDKNLPAQDQSFDVIIMHNVCEHIIDLDFWFSEYFRVLKTDGVFLNQFSPLFYSPYGAHLVDALKLPWGHLIFGVNAVVELRNLYYPGHLVARSWADLGLNRLTKHKYLKTVEKAGFRLRSFAFETSKGVPLGWVPWLRNLFIIQVTSVLTK